MGDIVHVLPAPGILKRAGVEKVGWLVEDRWSALVKGSEHVDRLHRLPRGRWRREGTGLFWRLRDLRALGRPLLVAASRKRFLGQVLAGRDSAPPPARERDAATAAVSTVSALAGAWAVRVHEVRASADAVRVFDQSGSPASFDPVTTGLNASGSDIDVDAPSGIACAPDGTIFVTLDDAYDDPLYAGIVRFDSVTGAALTGIDLPFRPGDCDLDSAGNLFVVEKIVDRFAPERVVLFGSHARGDAGPDSDVDLFIEMDVGELGSRRATTIRKALGLYAFPLDIVVYTPAEFQYWRQAAASLAATVAREGRVVYERTG